MPESVATVTSAPSRRRPVASMIGTTAAVAADIQALIAWSASGSVRITASGISPRSAATTPRGSKSREMPAGRASTLSFGSSKTAGRLAAFGGSMSTPMPVASAIVSGASERRRASRRRRTSPGRGRSPPRDRRAAGCAASPGLGLQHPQQERRGVASPRRATRMTSKAACGPPLRRPGSPSWRRRWRHAASIRGTGRRRRRVGRNDEHAHDGAAARSVSPVQHGPSATSFSFDALASRGYRCLWPARPWHEEFRRSLQGSVNGH